MRDCRDEGVWWVGLEIRCWYKVAESSGWPPAVMEEMARMYLVDD